MRGQHASDKLITRVTGIARRTKGAVDSGNGPRIADDAFEFLRIIFRELAGPHPSRRCNLGARQQLAIEHQIEIAVGFHNRGCTRLETDFGQLCLDEQGTETHIDLGAIETPVGQRHTRLPAENRRRIVIDAKGITHCGRLGDAGRAENVHQERVGAHGGVKLAPAAVGVELRLGKRAGSLRMNLVEAPHPIGVCSDGRVRRVEEISVAALFRRVNNHRRTSVAFHVWAPARKGAIAQGQLAPELDCIPARLQCHRKQATPAGRTGNSEEGIRDGDERFVIRNGGQMGQGSVPATAHHEITRLRQLQETRGGEGFPREMRLDQNRSVRHSRKAEYAAVALGFVGIAQRFGVVVG